MIDFGGVFHWPLWQFGRRAAPKRAGPGQRLPILDRDSLSRSGLSDSVLQMPMTSRANEPIPARMVVTRVRARGGESRERTHRPLRQRWKSRERTHRAFAPGRESRERTHQGPSRRWRRAERTHPGPRRGRFFMILGKVGPTLPFRRSGPWLVGLTWISGEVHMLPRRVRAGKRATSKIPVVAVAPTARRRRILPKKRRAWGDPKGSKESVVRVSPDGAQDLS